MDDPDYYAEIRTYQFVSSSKKWVCTGQTNGSYNYAHIDDVYPRDKPWIPVRGPHGTIDYVANPNFRLKTLDDKLRS
ncbi:MAG: hypothetical protein AABX51_06110 [Nanoarchaeota archaeon]